MEQLLEPPEGRVGHQAIASALFERRQWSLDEASVILDRFAHSAGVSCCFVRLGRSEAHIARFVLKGLYSLRSCSSGGWLLKPVEQANPAYWLPQMPVLRTLDSKGRILTERLSVILGIGTSSLHSWIDVDVIADAHLDFVLWRFPSHAFDFLSELDRPCTLEKQPVFMWGSHTAVRGAADLYLHLIHGHIYENRFEWRRKWKICAENEAYSLYVTMSGLELATNKRIYQLLKRQIVFSAIARQSDDGGWYHGEWSDFMESHYRLHNGGVLLLEAAAEEDQDEVVIMALKKAVAYTCRHVDNTDLGLWFLHDSLEEDLDLLHRAGSKLIPSRILGKSTSNKLILNTHLDAIVVLDRYAELTGDLQYAEQVISARGTARRMLALRPAEWLYRIVYWGVTLALLPGTHAKRLPFAVRALRRLTREYLLGRIHWIKRRYPRVVMPGGLIERHLSMPHFDVNYQTVNLMDMARVWRRFPDEDLSSVLNNGVNAVAQTSLLQYWVESKQKQGLGYWAEALYHLCTLNEDIKYRRYLAQAILYAEDAILGLPPSLLGANPEAVKRDDRIPCPSPADPRLRVANLSCAGIKEFLVVNCASAPIELAWEGDAQVALSWTDDQGQLLMSGESAIQVPARGWLWGRDTRRKSEVGAAVQN